MPVRAGRCCEKTARNTVPNPNYHTPIFLGVNFSMYYDIKTYALMLGTKINKDDMINTEKVTDSSFKLAPKLSKKCNSQICLF